jgi:hypothetical protein
MQREKNNLLLSTLLSPKKVSGRYEILELNHGQIN